jgi:hypothetical protein
MDLDTGKIPDAELRSFAQTPTAEKPRSVIVELESPPLAIAPLEKTPRPRYPGGHPAIPFDLTAVGEEHERMDQLQKELLALGLEEELVRLNAAQAFVVSASPAKLRALSRLPLVGVIRPNRTHHVPPRVMK